MKQFLCPPSVLVLLFAAALAVGRATPIHAQDGEFIVEPWRGGFSDAKVQWWDQKIMVLGDVDNRTAIARYELDGLPDAGFGSGGLALGSPDVSGQALTLQPDGKAVVSGFSNRSVAVARFNPDGTVDGGFGDGGWTSLFVGATFQQSVPGVGLQSTGKIVVSGSSSGASFPSFAGNVARFTTTGFVDAGKGAFGQVVKGTAIGYTTFGYPNAIFNRLAVQPDDRIVAVGSWVGSGLLVARYSANGTLDKTFNGRGYSLPLSAGTSASEVLVQGDGKIVVIGRGRGAFDHTDMLIARFLPTGGLDASFGGSGYVLFDVDGEARPSRENAADAVLQPDGKIVVSGSVMYDDVPGTQSRVFVARVDATGALDESFGSGGFKTGGPSVLQSFGGGVDLQWDGAIIVAGSVYIEENGTDVLHPLLMRFLP